MAEDRPRAERVGRAERVAGFLTGRSRSGPAPIGTDVRLDWLRRELGEPPGPARPEPESGDGWETDVAVTGEGAEDDPLVDPGYDLVDRNWVRYRPAWGGFLRFVIFVGLVVVAVVWARGRIYDWVDDQIYPGGGPGDPVEVVIAEGASVNEVATALDWAGVITNGTVFRYWLRCAGELTIVGFLGCDDEASFQAGDYIFRTNMDFESAVAVLDEGPIPEVSHSITIPEGLRWTRMAALLIEKNPSFDRIDLERAFVLVESDGQYLPEDSPVRTMEGLLFPATYDLGADDLGDEYSLLRRMSDEFDRRFTGLLEDPGLSPDVVELGLEPYEVVIVASMIEEEARTAEDRPKIARVIYNRLAIDERLGIDSTACYAANKPCIELTASDLENPSAWNTRAVAGLPPTPIAAPGEASLRAALQPAEGEWLFFVLVDEGGVPGAHHFSETLEEHNQYVEICRNLGYC